MPFPLLAAIPAWAWWTAGGLTVGSAMGWWGRGETDQLLEDYGPTPAIDQTSHIQFPVAPTTDQLELSKRNLFTPATVHELTTELQQKVNDAISSVRRVEGPAVMEYGAGVRHVAETDWALIGAGLAAAGLVVVLMKR